MFCRNCGRKLRGSPEICTNCGVTPAVGTSFCPVCGTPTTSITRICTNCGTGIAKARGKETWKPTAVGVLCIISGAIQLSLGIIVAIAGGIAGAFIGVGWLSIIGIPLIVMAIISIIGGVYALQRRIWGLALAGSICSLFTGIFIPGILAVLFVSLGKDEFE